MFINNEYIGRRSSFVIGKRRERTRIWEGGGGGGYLKWLPWSLWLAALLFLSKMHGNVKRCNVSPAVTESSQED